MTAAFRSGFVNIVGRPNAGKSTLMNALVGERMSIITPKPQTTRHRIIGILSGEDFQVVFSDTPGYVKTPAYGMHRAMNKFVEGAMEDADITLMVFDLTEELEPDNPFVDILQKSGTPVWLILNKSDLVNPQRLGDVEGWWRKRVNFARTFAISALKGDNTAELLSNIRDALPEGPPYYPLDQLTDRPERFFASEIIREKLFLLYDEEVPYSCEVAVTDFKETQTVKGEALARIFVEIYVMRETQKGILLGHKGAAIKKLGEYARKDLEDFLQTKVFLDMTVKVRDNWRDDDQALKRLGYL